MSDYIYKVMIALFMLVNVVFGGQIGQTLSARQHGLLLIISIVATAYLIYKDATK